MLSDNDHDDQNENEGRSHHQAVPDRSSDRLKSLDGLRGVAALIVLLHHGLLPIPDFANPLYGKFGAGSWDWLVFSPLHFFVAGTEAVLVFFVLSGFVLARPVLLTRRFSWRAYYPARLVRLYLPVIAAVTWAVALAMTLPRQSALSGDPSLWMRAHAESITFATPFMDSLLLYGASPLNGPLWSLRWEVIFSLLLPLYVWVGLMVKRAHVVANVLALAVTGAVATFLGVPALLYLLVFGIGVIYSTGLGHLNRLAHRISSSRFGGWFWSAISCIGALLLTTRWTVSSRVPHPWTVAVEALVVLGAATIVFVALGCPGAIRFLTMRPVQWLGAVSFSLYLTHEPIVIAVAQVLSSPADRFTILISTPLSLFVGWVFFLIVEQPTHRLSKKIRVAISTGREYAAKN